MPPAKTAKCSLRVSKLRRPPQLALGAPVRLQIAGAANARCLLRHVQINEFSSSSRSTSNPSSPINGIDAGEQCFNLCITSAMANSYNEAAINYDKTFSPEYKWYHNASIRKINSA